MKVTWESVEKRATNEMLVLLHLRALGPCSIKRVHDALPPTLLRQQVYEAMTRLRKKNLAVHLTTASYDVTKRGRRVCAELWSQGNGDECQKRLF